MGFSSGTLTLTLPTSYSSMTINTLTTATSFLYRGTEIATTLNNYLLITSAALTYLPISTAATVYQPIINTYTISGATGGSMGFSSGTLTLNMPTSYTSLSIASTATSFVYKGTELSTTLSTLGGTYQPIINTYSVVGATGGSMSFSSTH